MPFCVGSVFTPVLHFSVSFWHSVLMPRSSMKLVGKQIALSPGLTFELFFGRVDGLVFSTRFLKRIKWHFEAEICFWFPAAFFHFSPLSSIFTFLNR